MQSLIGDRFLKQFFGHRLHQQRAKPAGQATILAEIEENLVSAEKPDEPDCPPKENLPIKKAVSEQRDTFKKGKSEFKCEIE